MLCFDFFRYHSEKDCRKVPDQVLKSIHSCGGISFVFHQKSHDNAVKVEKSREEVKNNIDDVEDDNEEKENVEETVIKNVEIYI